MFSGIKVPNEVKIRNVAKTGVNDIYEELREKHIILPYLNDTAIARASLSTDFQDGNANIIISAREMGADGNDITVEFRIPEDDNASTPTTYCGLTIDGNVQVKLRCEAGTVLATANEVIAAIENNAEVSAIIYAVLRSPSDGTGVVEVLEETNLAGGVGGDRLVATASELNAVVKQIPTSINSVELDDGDYDIGSPGIYFVKTWAANAIKLPFVSTDDLGSRYIVINPSASAVSVLAVSGTIYGASSVELGSKQSLTFMPYVGGGTVAWASI